MAFTVAAVFFDVPERKKESMKQIIITCMEAAGLIDRIRNTLAPAGLGEVMIAQMQLVNQNEDTEGRHIELDRLLLQYIGVPEITAEFGRREKWYV